LIIKCRTKGGYAKWGTIGYKEDADEAELHGDADFVEFFSVIGLGRATYTPSEGLKYLRALLAAFSHSSMIVMIRDADPWLDNMWKRV
jgi:hypothetical protein